MCNPVRMDAKVWWPLISRRQAHLLTADAVLLHPKSRGRVSLRSADPLAKPRIQFNCLAEPDDLATLRRGLRAARRIYATAPQSDLIEREIVPGAEVSSDADLDAYIRATAGVTQHPVGTCSMAPGAGRVVDAQLRVQGVRRPARRRRVGHADGSRRQYLWRRAHDCRARRRSDPRPHAAAATGAHMTRWIARELRGEAGARLRRSHEFPQAHRVRAALRAARGWATCRSRTASCAARASTAASWSTAAQIMGVLRADNVLESNAHYIFEADDGALIQVHNRGYIYNTHAQFARAARTSAARHTFARRSVRTTG